jgi:hypothetical protein
VTEDGFRHLKLPPATYAWLRAWYDDKKLRMSQQESQVGPCMNQLDGKQSVSMRMIDAHV